MVLGLSAAVAELEPSAAQQPPTASTDAVDVGPESSSDGSTAPAASDPPEADNTGDAMAAAAPTLCDWTVAAPSRPWRWRLGDTGGFAGSQRLTLNPIAAFRSILVVDGWPVTEESVFRRLAASPPGTARQIQMTEIGAGLCSRQGGIDIARLSRTEVMASACRWHPRRCELVRINLNTRNVTRIRTTDRSRPGLPSLNARRIVDGGIVNGGSGSTIRLRPNDFAISMLELDGTVRWARRASVFRPSHLLEFRAGPNRFNPHDCGPSRIGVIEVCAQTLDPDGGPPIPTVIRLDPENGKVVSRRTVDSPSIRRPVDPTTKTVLPPSSDGPTPAQPREAVSSESFMIGDRRVEIRCGPPTDCAIRALDRAGRQLWVSPAEFPMAVHRIGGELFAQRSVTDPWPVPESLGQQVQLVKLDPATGAVTPIADFVGTTKHRVYGQRPITPASLRDGWLYYTGGGNGDRGDALRRVEWPLPGSS